MRIAHSGIVPLALAVAAGGASTWWDWPSTRLAIRVVDDAGTPVAGAHIVTDCYDWPPNACCLSDTNGVFQINDHIAGVLSCHTAKDGYYRTYGELWRGPVYGEETPPTNQYTVLLKRIIDPKPMVEQRVGKRIPQFDADLGFDLEVGDWVAPIGRGRVTDMIIRARFRNDGDRNYEKEMHLSFPGEINGILPYDGPNKLCLSVASVLPVPQAAPLLGYTNAWVATRSREPGEPPVSNMKETARQYIFRVRGQTNEAGEVKSANYGWILGDFDLRGPAIDLKLWYYFNPNPTSRSLEPAALSKKRERE